MLLGTGKENRSQYKSIYKKSNEVQFEDKNSNVTYKDTNISTFCSCEIRNKKRKPVAL